MSHQEPHVGLTYDEIARIAYGFVLESETWPVFLAWARKNANTDESRAWIDSSPAVEQMRREWLKHSPDPYIAELAGTIDDEALADAAPFSRPRRTGGPS